MNCERFREHISEFLEGELPPADAASAEAHRDGCADCRDYGADFAKFERFLGTFPVEEDVSPGLEARLRDIGNADAARPPSGRVIPFRRTIFALAAAAAIVAAVVLIWPDPIPGGIEARLYANRMVGRPVPNATYRIYGPETSQIFHDLALLNRPGSRSWNNLQLRATAPHVVTTADGSGRLKLDKPLGGIRLALIEKPGHLAAWGVLEPVGTGAAPARDVVLFPGRSVEVRGTLLDATSKRPLANAYVASLDGTGVTRTDAAGRFQGRFVFPESAEPRVYALAEGYAEASMTLPGQSTGPIPWDPSLAPTLRPSADLRLVDANGNAVAGTLALAYPQPKDDAQRDRIPIERRDKPEVALSDGNGNLVFRNLFDCPYRLEFVEGRAGNASEVFEPNAPPTTIAMRPAGDAGIRVRALRGGEPAVARMVFTPAADDGGTTPFMDGSTDNEGLVSFGTLQGGPGTLRTFTPEGHAYVVDFTVAPSKELECDYPMPETPHRLAGEVSAALRGRLVMLRLEGTVAPISMGGSVSKTHTFAVETPVRADGTFAFPPLPSLTAPKLTGRLKADPRTTSDALRTTPPLAECLAKGQPGSKALRVDE